MQIITSSVSLQSYNDTTMYWLCEICLNEWHKRWAVRWSMNIWTQISDHIIIRFINIGLDKRSLRWWYGTYWHNIIFSLSAVQQSSIFFAHRQTYRAIHTQLQFLKGKFHRLSGAIDFHLSMHRPKVYVDINQILADIISPHLVPASFKPTSLLLIIEFQQHSNH